MADRPNAETGFRSKRKILLSFVSIGIGLLSLMATQGFSSSKTKPAKRNLAGEATLRLALMECEYTVPNSQNFGETHTGKKHKKHKIASNKRTLTVERQVRRLDQGISDVYFIYVQEGQKRLKEFEIPEGLMTYDSTRGRLKCSLRNQMNAAHIEEIDFDLSIENASFRYQNGQTYDEVNTQGTVEPKCRELRLADSQARLQRFFEQAKSELDNE